MPNERFIFGHGRLFIIVNQVVMLIIGRTINIDDRHVESRSYQHIFSCFHRDRRENWWHVMKNTRISEMIFRREAHSLSRDETPSPLWTDNSESKIHTFDQPMRIMPILYYIRYLYNNIWLYCLAVHQKSQRIPENMRTFVEMVALLRHWIITLGNTTIIATMTRHQFSRRSRWKQAKICW
jgi:hypothetical protein